MCLGHGQDIRRSTEQNTGRPSKFSKPLPLASYIAEDGLTGLPGLSGPASLSSPMYEAIPQA